MNPALTGIPAPVSTSPIEPERLKLLNPQPIRPEGDHVLYWMQASQRADFNPALEHALSRANDLGLPLRVLFALTAYPEANLRHYRFMLEGLQQTARELGRRGIRFDLLPGRPTRVVLEASSKAALLVCDGGELAPQRAWRQEVAEAAGCRVERVEGDVVVPVETASERLEVAARTLRPRILRQVSRFLRPLAPQPVAVPSPPGPDLAVEALLDGLPSLDRTVPGVERFFRGGTPAARQRFEAFLEAGLSPYLAHRNHPQTAFISQMSVHLHFGQVSPVWLALRAEDSAGSSQQDSLSAFLEQLVVRRELAFNHVHYNPDHASFKGLPEWARRTLAEHRPDPRPLIYTRPQLLEARTHDPYWNAAMLEMRETGYMHNYMRMYWGKKILEWTADPEEAFETALFLNNRYLLDGRDPVSYASVGWIFGLHDRPWPQRAIYGNVRSMTAGGLEKKTDPTGYVRRVESLLRGQDPSG